jgi:hypothetical protein
MLCRFALRATSVAEQAAEGGGLSRHDGRGFRLAS